LATKDNAEIRDSVRSDVPAIEALYARAFPDEDLVPLLHSLLAAPDSTISLVTIIDTRSVRRPGNEVRWLIRAIGQKQSKRYSQPVRRVGTGTPRKKRPRS
jgi:hypothetical protein